MARDGAVLALCQSMGIRERMRTRVPRVLKWNARSTSIMLVLMTAASCINDGEFGGHATLPDPPDNPGSLQALLNTVWEAPGGTITFYNVGSASFRPKQPGAAELRGSFTYDNGIAYVVIIGVEPIAAVWNGETLTIQGVECRYIGKVNSEVQKGSVK